MNRSVSTRIYETDYREPTYDSHIEMQDAPGFIG